MRGPREHGEQAGLTSPRERETPGQSGGVGAGPSCWRPDKATVFQLASVILQIWGDLVQQKTDEIHQNVPKVIPEWGGKGV